jgi:hypothetical protein
MAKADALPKCSLTVLPSLVATATLISMGSSNPLHRPGALLDVILPSSTKQVKKFFLLSLFF